MDSSIKQWHKSILFACVALLALGSTAMAQTDYISGPTYILNAFEASADEVLNGVNLWALGYETYEVSVYSSFNPGTGAFGTELASGTGTTTTGGQFDISLDTSLALTNGSSYYLHVTSLNAVNFGYLGVKGNFSASFDSPLDNVSYFSSNGTTWTDLYNGPWTGLTQNGGGAVTAPANFLVGLNMSPPPNIEATALEGTWTITDQSFDGDHTLNVDKTANEMTPFVMQIDVDSDMGQMTLTEEVFNDIAERDWTGYGFQLGLWNGSQFTSSVNGDGLAFTISQDSDLFSNFTVLSEDHIRFNNGLLEPGESVQFALAIDLPGGLDSYTFAIRQYAVPEPSSFLLLAMSGVILLCSRRRR